MKKLLLTLVLGVVAALGLGGSAQAAAPWMQQIDVPTYSGGDGTGTWSTHYAFRDEGQYMVEAISYLWVPDLGMNFRTTSGYDTGSDTILPGGPTHFSMAVQYNTPSYCPYHGFHWFGTTLTWRYKYVIGPGETITNPGNYWSAWSSWRTEPAGPGVYGQACL